MLEKEPRLSATTLFEYLQGKYPNKYTRSQLRTLQKRVREWKAAHGPAKEVMFAQEHQPGSMGLSDFTHLKQATITIGGQPLTHILYHYRLVGFLGRERVLSLERVFPKPVGGKRRARSVDYRHVIDSLRRKPRAFLGYKWREDLLPSESYRLSHGQHRRTTPPCTLRPLIAP
jgi:hypothetical protein